MTSDTIDYRCILRKGNGMTRTRQYPSRFVVTIGPDGNGTIRARKHVGVGKWGSVYSGKNGPYAIGYIFWSGAASDFYTVELRDSDPLARGHDDSAFFIVGTATTFEAAVSLASDYLAERLEIV